MTFALIHLKEGSIGALKQIYFEIFEVAKLSIVLMDFQ
jgi:hypothetical protein